MANKMDTGTVGPSESKSLRTHADPDPQLVLLIRDVYPGSRILTFIHPSRSDPTATEERKKLLSNLFCNLNIYFEEVKKKM